MEKCTFCIQRIAEARIAADRESRPVGEVRTACQAACPTQAFTFGNLADPDSEVAKRKQSPLDYALLERPEHPSAHHLRGAHPQPQSRHRGGPRMSDIPTSRASAIGAGLAAPLRGEPARSTPTIRLSIPA